MPHADLMRMEEPPPEMQPHLAKPPRIDEREAFLTTLFLRRYVTYCAQIECQGRRLTEPHCHVSVGRWSVATAFCPWLWARSLAEKPTWCLHGNSKTTKPSARLG